MKEVFVTSLSARTTSVFDAMVNELCGVDVWFENIFEPEDVVIVGFMFSMCMTNAAVMR